MKYIFSFVLFFACLITQGQDISIFLPDSSDVLKHSDFDKTSELIIILENEKNKEFLKNFIEKFGTQYQFEKQYQDFLNKNIDDWEMDLYDIRNKEITFLNDNKSNITPELYDFLSQDIKYNYWHLLLAYPVLRSNLDIKMKTLVSIPTVMTDPISKLKLNEPSNLMSNNFRKFLNFFVTYFNSQEHKFVKYSDMVQSTIDKSEFAMKNLNGQNLDYMTATLLEANKDRISSSAARFMISQIESVRLQNYCKTNTLVSIFANEEKQALKAKEDSKKKKDLAQSNLPILLDLNEKSFNFSKYEGKVIYVDIWASWCGPCRREFPYSKTMHSQLSEKQKKEIVFLYISIDDDPKNWKEAINKMELGDFEHGYSKGGWSSEMVQKYKISGIPRYMIIDKMGKVVNPDAPRPSNPETLDELLKLTKK
jgi:thiol-disulfide isomerase/thioredoxin